jgi:hypothetical protein
MSPSIALSPIAAPPAPWRVIAALTVIVLAAHLLLLGFAPVMSGAPPAPLTREFITRTIVVAPPVAREAPLPATAAPKPPPRPRPTVRPRPPAPVPAPEAEITAPAQPPSEEPVAQAPPQEEVVTAPSPGNGEPSVEPVTAVESSDAAAANMPGAVPLRVPGSVRLSFAATGQQGAQPLGGVFGRLDWLQDGERYDAQLSLSLLFKTLRTQHSTGAIGATGIEPLRFADTRRTEVAAHFVRDRQTVIFSNNTPPVPLLAGAQDRLSVVLQLGALIAGDPPRYPPDSMIAVQTVGSSDAEIWTFHVSGDEAVSVPAGDFTARRLVRNPRKPFDDTVELWLAQELNYLPVRLKFTQPNGDFADLQLRERPSPP